jgi:hypothetical protein
MSFLFGHPSAPAPPPPPPHPPTLANAAVQQAGQQAALEAAAASGQGFSDTIKTSSLGAPKPGTTSGAQTLGGAS